MCSFDTRKIEHQGNVAWPIGLKKKEILRIKKKGK